MPAKPKPILSLSPAPALAFTLALTLTAPAATPATDTSTRWQQMDTILARITPPAFPPRDFPITAYGAKPTTSATANTDSRPAILAAIAACAASGGGRVIIPPGEYLSNGPIHLQSNINLHLADGATLKFGPNPKDYLPVVLTRWEGIRVYNYSPLIYARGQKNIAITGKGLIDGGGKEGMSNFIKVKTPDGKHSQHEADRQLLWKMGAAKVPLEKRIFGEGHYLRPGGIEPYECENILISGVTITNMPFWCVHPIFCKNVTIDSIHIESTTGNNDGVDPDSCADVLIQNCYFKTGDDSIAIKSGRDQDAWEVARPSENIIIRNCVAAGKLYGYAIGSEISGGVRNIYIQDCEVRSGRAGLYTKTNPDRGGYVENVNIRRVKIARVNEAAIRFEGYYHGYRGEKHPTRIHDYLIEDITCEATNNYAIYIHGQEDAPMENIHLRNIRIGPVKTPLWMHNITPKTIRLENVRIDGKKFESPPPLTPATEKKLPIRD